MKTEISFEQFNRALDLEPIKFLLVQPETGPGWSIEQVQVQETWYRRFLYLVCLHPEKTIVPTRDIDTFWHIHILDSRKYMADCETLFGRYFHHFPYFGLRGEADKQRMQKAFDETDALFQKQFGESPLSLGIADCGGLCNEPTPKSDSPGLDFSTRPVLAHP